MDRPLSPGPDLQSPGFAPSPFKCPQSHAAELYDKPVPIMPDSWQGFM